MRDAIRPGDPAQAIPDTLRDLDRWLTWELAANARGKLTKVPSVSTASPAAWKPFDAVDGHPMTAFGGLGFVVSYGVPGGLFAFDLDSCRNPATGELAPWARRVIDETGRSYTEATPSGTGVRVWVAVRHPPHRLARSRFAVDAAPMPGCDRTKRVELQVFGAGPPAYVTVTGLHVPGTSRNILSIGRLDDVGLLRGATADAATAEGVDGLPEGSGPVPSLEALGAALAATEVGRAFVAGDWRRVLEDGPAGTDRSASAAFFRGAALVLQAANGHGRPALEFLLRETAWGRGEIEDSSDPLRYTRSSWVAKELGRVATRAVVYSAAAFDDGFDASTWSPPAAPVAAAGRTRLVHVRDFLSGAAEDPFLVYGVLPRAGLAQFFGDPGCGKTPYALSLAVHVAGGLRTWFGHDIDRAGPVAYIIGEDAGGIRRRLGAEIARVGLDPAALPIHVSTEPGQLTQPGDADAWIADIRARVGDAPALIVVDTLARNFGPGNENATDDMGAFIAALTRLTTAFGCLVLLVHHTGHVAKDRGRGNSALQGALDASYEIRRAQRSQRVTAVARKSKNWSDPEPLVGTLHVVEVGTDSKGRPVTAVTLLDRGQTSASVFAELDPAERDPVRRVVDAVRLLAGGTATLAELSARTELDTGRPLRGALNRAIELGLVVAEGGGRGRKVRYVLGAGADAELEADAEDLLRLPE